MEGKIACHVAAPEHAECKGCGEGQTEGDVVEKCCQKVDQLLQSGDVVLMLCIMGFYLYKTKLLCKMCKSANSV
jgi:hypothetical protein